MTRLVRPQAIILMRHAEEPEEDVPYLSAEGMARAQALPTLFKTHEALKNLSDPVALFAAGAKKGDSSIRSIQTLHYLSEFLEIEINDDFKRDDFYALTKEILTNEKYDDEVIVICWQHKIMRKIAEHLGVENAPAYPSSRFDRLWVLRYPENKMTPVFEDHPQKLMPEDPKT